MIDLELLDACTRLVRTTAKMVALHREDMKLLEQLKVKPEAAYYLDRTQACGEAVEAGKTLLLLLEEKRFSLEEGKSGRA